MYNDEIYWKELGRMMKDARLRKNLSLRDVEERIQFHKKRSMISMYENGTAKMTTKTFDLLCDVYGLDRAQTTKELSRKVSEIVAINHGGLTNNDIIQSIITLVENPNLTKEDLESIYDFIQFKVEKRK